MCILEGLEKKLKKDPANTQYIHTKWGVGYYFRGPKGNFQYKTREGKAKEDLTKK